MDEMLIVNRRRRGPYYKMAQAHSHDAYEIYYLVSGNRRFFINDSIYYIKAGDLVIIPKGEIHRTSYDSDSTHERFFVYFSEEYLAELFKVYGRQYVLDSLSHPHIPVPMNRRNHVEGLLNQLETEYEHGDRFSPTLLKDCLSELLIFILRYQEYHTRPENGDIGSDDSKMQDAARYISRNFQQGLTLDAVAAYVGLSAPYFSKKFKEATGFGFKEYLVNVRIRAAASLLLETQSPITWIAYECGFNDSNYFGDVFRKVKGISPSRYRKGKGNLL